MSQRLQIFFIPANKKYPLPESGGDYGDRNLSPGSQPGALPISYRHSFASWIRTTISAFKALRPAVRRRQKSRVGWIRTSDYALPRHGRTARTSPELRPSLPLVRNLRFARLPLLPEKKKPRQIARAAMISFRSCYCKSKSNIRKRPNSPSRGCWSRC
jgi:hypothetical protein